VTWEAVKLGVAVALGIVVGILMYQRVGRRVGRQIRVWLRQGQEHITRRTLQVHGPNECPACACADGKTPVGGVSVPTAWKANKSYRGRRKQACSEGYACPNAQCMYYQVTDHQRHALVSNGWRGKRERIRQWGCQACGTRFTSRRHTAMYWLKTPSGQVGQVMLGVGEGLSLAASARVFGHHAATVTRHSKSRLSPIISPLGSVRRTPYDAFFPLSTDG